MSDGSFLVFDPTPAVSEQDSATGTILVVEGDEPRQVQRTGGENALLVITSSAGVGPSGATGPAGRGVTSIGRTSGTGAAGTTDVYTITYSDTTTQTFSIVNGALGATGATGRGITSIERTSGTGLAGSLDTYTITYSDASTMEFQLLNGTDGTDGIDGVDGIDGRGISSVTRTAGTGLAGITDTYTITYSDATTSTYTVVNGANGTNGTNGVNGRGVTSIARTSGTGLAGSTDTYTITYSDATTSTYTVVNGLNGAAGTNGTNGNAILTGTAAPSNAVGANGDYFIDSLANKIYGPKAAGVWPAGKGLGYPLYVDADGVTNVTTLPVNSVLLEY